MCFGRKSRDQLCVRIVLSSVMLLPDQTYENRSYTCRSLSTGDIFDISHGKIEKTLAVLHKCDEFLKRYRIKPEFFCKHREKLALQTWIIQQSSRLKNEGEYIDKL